MPNVPLWLLVAVVVVGSAGVVLFWPPTSHNVPLAARDADKIDDDDRSSPDIFGTDLGNPTDLARMLDERLCEIREDSYHLGQSGRTTWLFIAVDLRNLCQSMGVHLDTWIGFDDAELDQAEASGEYPMGDEG
ncbi:MAG: hypothetical protein JSS23_11235 [Proteobacteria bacterium]|nr:hypothetical protein [Pseudomonadota bacterium]